MTGMGMFGEIAAVTGYLYLSGQSAVTRSEVDRLGVNLLVRCLSKNQSDAAVSSDTEVVSVPVEDSPNSSISAYFDNVCGRIESNRLQNGKALVYCQAGISRSATIVLAYLVKHQGFTLMDAYTLVKKARPFIRPNLGFWSQLVDYERSIRGSSSISMVPSPLGFIPSIYEAEMRMLV